LQRLEAAAQEGGPVEEAWRAVGKAELARAQGRPDPDLWLAAAAEWEAIDRPYLAALARFHAAQAQAESGDREAATVAAASALEATRRIGSSWLLAELTALVQRARLELGDGEAAEPVPAPEHEDPFGLTPRERQVLALIAEGATN